MTLYLFFKHIHCSPYHTVKKQEIHSHLKYISWNRLKVDINTLMLISRNFCERYQEQIVAISTLCLLSRWKALQTTFHRITVFVQVIMIFWLCWTTWHKNCWKKSKWQNENKSWYSSLDVQLKTKYYCVVTVWKLRKFTLTNFQLKLREINKLLLNYTASCFHEIFFMWEWIFRFSTLCKSFVIYLIGDHAGVENLPLMWPTSLSISFLRSWYSFTSVLEGTATCRKVTLPLHWGYFSNNFSKARSLATKPLV